MTIALIVAMSENRVIGRDGDLPWHLPADLKHFMDTTRGHPVIMGRKTFESLGKPLPGRTNIVITRDQRYGADDAVVVHSLDDAIQAAKSHVDDDEIFILGGSEIFSLALPMADLFYLTVVHGEVEGDTYFPEWDEDQWQLVEERHHPADDRHEFAMTFRLYERD